MINNIKNNTISEALAKQKLDALNEIRKVETKNKRLINGQKILLSLFDDLVEAIYFVKKKIIIIATTIIIIIMMTMMV